MPKKPKEDAADELLAEENKEEADEAGSEEGSSLVSLKKSPEQIKKDRSPMAGPSIGPPEEYDYGTTISLSAELLDKLGLKDIPKIGQAFSIDAVAEVISVSANASRENESREVRLQITAMNLESSAQEKE